jgi:amino acid adenylation domain-containing protein
MGLLENEVVDVNAKTVFERAYSRDDVLHLSPAQERIWFLEQMEPGNPINLLFHIFHLSGKLDDKKLQTALDEVVRRQEALRTTFAAAAIYAGIDGRPVPIVTQAPPRTLRIIDLAHLGRTEREAAVANLTKLAARKQFDLSRGPLFRIKLLRLSDDEHLLLLSMHRSIADKASCLIFVQELFRLYQSLIDDSPSTIEPLAIQYTAIATRQRAWLQTDVAKGRVTEATGLLRDAPGLLELPADRPRPPKRSYGGARASVDLPARIAGALAQLGERTHSSSSTILLTVFQTLLARYTSQSEVVVGIPVSGRSAETQSLIGPLANSVVLRTKVVSEDSFLEQLERTARSLATALLFQDVPFERLVDELDPERSLSHTPVFQVTFRSEDAAAKYDLPHVSEMRRDEVSEFDLSMSVALEDDSLIVALDYNTDLFDASTIERLLKNFAWLLERVVRDPEQRLATVQLIHSEERRLLDSWNATEERYERDAPLHELIERQAALHGDEVAVVFGTEQLSYAELNGRANQLAAYVRKRLAADSLVGIYLDRGPEMVVALLAVLKAGAAYVPLAPEHPAARLEYMIEDAGLELIIAQPHLRERLPGRVIDRVAVVDLEAEADAIAAESRANVQSSVSGQSLAYVIYTSGSTGQPKAVEIPQAAVVNFLTSMQKRPGLSATDRILAVTTLSFDIAALELYLPLTVGGSVELVSRAEAADGQYLKAKLESGQITTMQATPATWRLLVEAGWEGKQRLKILCGGEALPRELANELQRRASAVWNMYGPTETTIWSAVGRLAETEGPVLLGEPIANTRLYVLDDALQLVPIGVAGELYIGGEGLARGYHGRAALTAERFVPDPYARAAGARMYRTGDLVRRQADGRLEFLGRLDHQVKIRGFRIETGEIESLLRQHPAVRDTVVVIREDSGEKRLVAYVLFQPNETLATAELRVHLQQSLPDYMIPTAFIVLDELPLTASGKVDRRRLPQPDAGRPALDFVAPRTPIEQEVAGIWEQVLKVKGVGVYDNFFDLGGHSLLATRVISRVNESLHMELPLRSMFEHPTLAGFAIAAARHQAISLQGEALQLLDEISEMSDEEAQQLLDAEIWNAHNDLSGPNSPD